LTEAEWATCSSPYDMLCYLDGKVGEAGFVRFNVASCRRLWPLVTDPRSRAVVEATEQWLTGNVNAEDLQRVLDEWSKVYKNGLVSDLAGGNTNGAIICVTVGWLRYATSVAHDCSESVGYAASESLRKAGAPQSEITAVWRAAADVEKAEQCQLLRDLFGHVPKTK
jgi:hypothetical protein